MRVSCCIDALGEVGESVTVINVMVVNGSITSKLCECRKLPRSAKLPILCFDRFNVLPYLHLWLQDNESSTYLKGK